MSHSRAEPPLAPDPAGVLRIAGTRVSLESLVSSYQAGAAPHELARAFPDLTLDDVQAALLYYREHRAEVEEYLAARRRAAEVVEARIREDFPWAYRRLAARSQGPGQA